MALYEIFIPPACAPAASGSLEMSGGPHFLPDTVDRGQPALTTEEEHHCTNKEQALQFCPGSGRQETQERKEKTRKFPCLFFCSILLRSPEVLPGTQTIAFSCALLSEMQFSHSQHSSPRTWFINSKGAFDSLKARAVGGRQDGGRERKVSCWSF